MNFNQFGPPDTENDFTDADKAKLDGIATGAEVNTVDSVAGKTGAVTLASTDLTDTAKVVLNDQENTFSVAQKIASGVYLGGTVAANLLDDYEEGTWTPQIGGDTSGEKSVASGNYGWYVKTGSLVICGGTLLWDGTESLTGSIAIKNLPFTNNSTTGNRIGGVLGAIGSGLSFSSGTYTSFSNYTEQGQSFATVVQNGDGVWSSTPTVANSGAIYGFSIMINV